MTARRYIGDTSLAVILRILVGSQSGPDAFAGFRFCNNFSIPGVVNTISGIDESGDPQ